MISFDVKRAAVIGMGFIVVEMTDKQIEELFAKLFPNER